VELLVKIFLSSQKLILFSRELPLNERNHWQKKEEDLESFSEAVLKEDLLGPVYQIQLMRLK